MSLKKYFFQWVAFALGFLITLSITVTGVAFAANSGGIFGNILNKILASGDYANPGDGTVKNAEKLWGTPATAFQKVAPGQSCGPGQCISVIDNNGIITCH